MASNKNQIDMKEIHEFIPLAQNEIEAEQRENEPLSPSIDLSAPNPKNKKETKSVQEPLPTCQKSDYIILGVILVVITLLYIYFSSPVKHDPPTLILNSLYVSNFTVGIGGLVATWDGKFTIINHSTLSSVSIRNSEVTISYEQNPLSQTTFSCDLDKEGPVTFYVRLLNEGTSAWKTSQPYVEDKVVQAMSTNLAKFRYLNFGMHVKVYAFYYDKSWFSSMGSLEVMTTHVEDIKIVFFPNHKGFGRLINIDRKFSIPTRYP